MEAEETRGLGPLHSPVPGTPSQGLFLDPQTRGNSAVFSGGGLGLRGPQPPSPMTRGKRKPFFGGFWGVSQKLGDKQNHGTFGTFADRGKVRPPTGAMQDSQAPHLQRLGSCTGPGGGHGTTGVFATLAKCPDVPPICCPPVFRQTPRGSAERGNPCDFGLRAPGTPKRASRKNGQHFPLFLVLKNPRV